MSSMQTIDDLKHALSFSSEQIPIQATSYQEAGNEVLKKSDLACIQKSSYEHFLNEVLPYYLNSTYYDRDGKISIKFTDWYLDKASELPADYCTKYKKTREIVVKATALVSINHFILNSTVVHPHTFKQTVEITKFPSLTDTGSLVINGINRVVISHLEAANTIILKSGKSGKILSFDSVSRASNRNKNTSPQSVRVYYDKKDSIIKVRVGNGLWNLMNILKEYSDITISGSMLQDLLGNSLIATSQIPNMLNKSTEQTNVKVMKESTTPFPVALKNFVLRTFERKAINEKLSLITRLIGKELAEDFVFEDVTLSAGTILNEKMCRLIQAVGGEPYVYTDSEHMSTIKVIGNKFAFIKDVYENLLGADMSELPEKYSRLYVNINLFKTLYEKSIEDKSISFSDLIQLNYGELVGRSLNINDIVAMANYYGHFLSNDVEEDDIDSLANKSIINISELYEEELFSRFPYTASNLNYYNIYGGQDIIKQALNQLTLYCKSSSNESDAIILGGLNLNLNWSVNNYDYSITDAVKRKTTLFAIEDTTSAASQLNIRRKVSSLKVEGRGGVPHTTSEAKIRSINNSYPGRLDVVESPEGSSIGLIRYLTALAKIDEAGYILAPFFPVNHQTKKIDYSTVYYLKYTDEDKYIRAISPRIADKNQVLFKIIDKDGKCIKEEVFPVSYDKNGNLFNINSINVIKRGLLINNRGCTIEIEYHKKDWFIDTNVTGFAPGGKPVSVNCANVELVTVKDEHICSVVTSTVPFIQNTDSARQLMAAQHAKQAINTKGHHKPYIATEMSKRVGETSLGVKTSPVDGIITHVSPEAITIKDNLGKDIIVHLLHDFTTSVQTMIFSTPIVKAGDYVFKGDVIADSNMTEDGEMASGINAVVAFLPWYGRNFEDSIVVSDRLVTSDSLTSLHSVEKVFTINSKEEITTTDGRKLPAEKVFRITDSDAADLRSAQTFTSIPNVKSLDLDKGNIRVGSKVKPNDVLGLTLKLEPNDSGGGYSSHYKLRKSVWDLPVEGVVIDITRGKNVNDIEYLSVTVAYSEKIQAGDKMSGRHGNKGVISGVVRQSDMPFLEDGTPVDIILTPLGVPSRMNIGQIIELQLAVLLHIYGLRVNVKTLTKINMDKLKEILSYYRDANGNPTDKVQLYDGMTGEPYEMLSNVGILHMYKSMHQVSHKIFARSGGTYDTYGQPPQGKQSDGGQKLGAMEWWSLAEHGCDKVMQELATFKSDDLGSREYYQFAKDSTKGNITDTSVYLREATDIGNLPKSSKIRDALLLSSFINTKYFNSMGEELNGFEDIVDSQFNVPSYLDEPLRIKKVSIPFRRAQVRDRVNMLIGSRQQFQKHFVLPEDIINGYSDIYKDTGVLESEYAPVDDLLSPEEMYDDIFGIETDDTQVSLDTTAFNTEDYESILKQYSSDNDIFSGNGVVIDNSSILDSFDEYDSTEETLDNPVNFNSTNNVTIKDGKDGYIDYNPTPILEDAETTEDIYQLESNLE